MKQIRNLPHHVILLVIIAPFIFWFVPLVTGQALYWGTPALQFIPWRILGLEQISQGVVPLWNPANGLGAPLLANYQTAFFYPPGWILYILGWLFGNGGIAWGFTFLLALHASWAGLGMACLASKYTKSSVGITISAFAYSLGSFFIARAGFFPMVWTGSWFPWMLLSISEDLSELRFIWKPDRFPYSSILVTSMALLAGHAQLSWYMLIFTGVWVIVTALSEGNWRAFWKQAGGFLGVMAIAGILTSIQLIPTAELLINSQRSSSVPFDAGLTYSYWPWRLITLFAPDFFGNPALGNFIGFGTFWEDAAYIGMVPLFLVLSTVGLVFRRSKPGDSAAVRKTIILLWIMIIIGFVFALGKNTPVFVFLYKYIPTFDMFNAPVRFLIWVHFSLCLLAAIASSRWTTPAGRGLYWLRLGTAGSVSIVITSIVLLTYSPGNSQHFFRAAIIFGSLSFIMGGMTLIKAYAERKNYQPAWIGAILIVTLVDLIAAGFGLNPTLPASKYDLDATSVSVPGMDGRTYMDAKDEYTLKFSKFYRFSDYRPLNEPDDVLLGILPNTNLLGATERVNNFDPLQVASFSDLMERMPGMDDQVRLNWLRLMDVHWLVGLDLTQKSGVSVSEVDNHSRVWWFSCNENANSYEAAAVLSDRVMANWDGREPLEMVITEGAPVHGCAEKDSTNSFAYQIVSETPINIKMQISAGGDGWVLLSDTWYPGWKAMLDGKRVEIFRGFSNFRTVWVPAGTHTVEMKYQPPSYAIGAGLSISGWLFLAILAIVQFIKKTNAEK